MVCYCSPLSKCRALCASFGVFEFVMFGFGLSGFVICMITLGFAD